ncbi:MAG: outer membrane lipoprotein-sorting protein [Bacteroidia bacterium]
MKTKALLFFAFIFALSVNAQNVDEIINHHLDAMGGAKKLEALKSVKMTGSIEVSPGMKAPFSIEIKDNKKMRFELEIQGMKMVQACDGDSGWKVVPFTGKTDPERMSPEEVKDSKEQADITGDLFDYKKKGNKVELIDKEDMEGTDVYKLKVTKSTGDVSYSYIDATTYLCLKQTTIIKLKDKEVKSTTILTNYQDVDGYKFPFSIEARQGDGEEQGQAMVFEKVVINPVIDDKDFVMPAAAPASPAGQTK